MSARCIACGRDDLDLDGGGWCTRCRPRWRVQVMRGGSGTITHPVIAIAPGCPDQRHPTRDCRCRVFRSRALAERYIAEQEASR